MSGRPRTAVLYGDASLELPPTPMPLDRIPARCPARRGAAAASLEAALSRPIGSAALEEVVRGARKVLVVVSDATRSTGSALFLPPLVERIRRAGGASITFLVASGIHRPPTDAEIEAILSPALAARFPALRHDPDDTRRLVPVGTTRSGTLVRVNAALREHDRVILTGGAGFHYYAGFSGGRKALVPGLAARDTVTRNHLRALSATGARAPGARAGRLARNPVHRDMVEGAALVSADFLLNTVLDEQGACEAVFAGHWRRAHEAACRYLRATRVLRVEPRDFVLASAGGEPADIDLIQAHKAYEAAVGAVRPGGPVILVARCRKGAGHPDFLPWFRFRSEPELVRELKRNFQVYGQTALSWLRKTRSHPLILVSGLPADLVRSLGAEPAADLEQALRIVREIVGPAARGWLLDGGARTLIEPAASP